MKLNIPGEENIVKSDQFMELDGYGEKQTMKADMVVHGAGRVPEIGNLDLEAAGVERQNIEGIKVNEYLHVSNPAVYAAGDAAASGGLPLTPVAAYDGEIVASNILKIIIMSNPNYKGVPRVVFTIPPLASIGLQEEVAREQGLHFKTKKADTSSWYSSRRIGEKYSGFKVLIEEGTDRILGAQEEVINIFAIATQLGLRATDIKQDIVPQRDSDISYML